MHDYPNLFSPIKVGNLTLRNRIEASATSLQEYDEGGFMKRTGLAYFREKAAGGCSMVVVGETPVDTATGLSHPKMLAIDRPECIPMLYDISDAIHQQGAIASLQIAHGGALCTKEFLGGKNPIGPSAMINPHGDQVDEMDEDMIEMIVGKFGDAALTLKKAGFDMCQLHAGHGWLIGQFLSPITNKRKDRFGGSLENRARFMMMIVDDIRKKCGNFPIEVRISGTEACADGYDLNDGIEFAKMLDPKIDMFNVSIGTVFNPAGRTVASPGPHNPHAMNVYLAAEFKKHVMKPVATLGAITTPELMEDIIASGKADIICTARTVIADQHFAKKAKSGRRDEIRPCLRCLGCMDNMLGPTQKLRCAVNPTVGREDDFWKMPPAAEHKKVLVIGGGPGGMQAAITAAERGHTVTLCEKTGELGGALKLAKYVDFKADMAKYRDWLEHMLYKRNVRVLLNVEADAELVALSSADVVIAAVGAEPITPPIPGIDSKNVIFATAMHNEGVAIGENVVVIGGGAVGCESAIWLAKEGKKPVVLEMKDDYMIDAGMSQRIYTETAMEELGIVPQVSVNVVKIENDSVIAQDKDGNKLVFPADTVVIAAGFRSLEKLREELRLHSVEFIPVGDCVKPGKIMDATASGHAAAMYL